MKDKIITLYNATRQANLNAQTHEELRKIAHKLVAYIDEQENKQEEKKETKVKTKKK